MKLFAILSSVTALAVSAVAIPLEVRNSIARVRAADVAPGGRGTFFHPGLGACGESNTDSDAVVAIGAGIFDNGAHCLQWVKISANGLAAFGQVVDVCESCGNGDLDMSPSLFEVFAPLSAGVVEVSWNFEPFGFQPHK